MYKLLGAFLLIHAIGHLAGFVELSGLRREGALAPATLLDGRVPVRPAVSKAIGVAWLALGLAFMVASTAVWVRAPWWTHYTAVLGAFSLGLSALCWPASKLGVPINLGLLVLLLAAQYAGGLRDLP